jgi:hypothetical protein
MPVKSPRKQPNIIGHCCRQSGVNAAERGVIMVIFKIWCVFLSCRICLGKWSKNYWTDRKNVKLFFLEFNYFGNARNFKLMKRARVLYTMYIYARKENKSISNTVIYLHVNNIDVFLAPHN